MIAANIQFRKQVLPIESGENQFRPEACQKHVPRYLMEAPHAESNLQKLPWRTPQNLWLSDDYPSSSATFYVCHETPRLLPKVHCHHQNDTLERIPCCFRSVLEYLSKYAVWVALLRSPIFTSSVLPFEGGGRPNRADRRRSAGSFSIPHFCALQYTW